MAHDEGAGSDPHADRSRAKRASGFLEICVDSLVSAHRAIAGGADQIELCSALALGGLTPSQGLAEAVLAVARPAGVAVRAMVRPRAGDFAYNADEMAIAAGEARALLAAGVDGLVFGVARHGAIDWLAMNRWRDRAGAPHITLHRAIDTVADPIGTVAEAGASGIDQILSSGGQPRAIDGIATLSAMAERAEGRCRVVAGAGVDPGNARLFVAAGLRALHATARSNGGRTTATVPDPLGFGLAFAPADETIVRALREEVDNANI